jgi:hypothetical protein
MILTLCLKAVKDAAARPRHLGLPAYSGPLKDLSHRNRGFPQYRYAQDSFTSIGF